MFDHNDSAEGYYVFIYKYTILYENSNYAKLCTFKFSIFELNLYKKSGKKNIAELNLFSEVVVNVYFIYVTALVQSKILISFLY